MLENFTAARSTSFKASRIALLTIERARQKPHAICLSAAEPNGHGVCRHDNTYP